ncbi:hypothetical protein CS8_094770 [Cupriavidus sp. 8B]
MGTGQAELFAQELDEKGVGFYLRVDGAAVDGQADRNRHACLHVGGHVHDQSLNPEKLRGTGHDALLPFVGYGYFVMLVLRCCRVFIAGYRWVLPNNAAP